MSDTWSLYQEHPSFVLGFHGTEQALVKKILLGKINHLDQSQDINEWLGHGIYFWENDPRRGLEWAENGKSKAKIKKPDVIGAVINLGNCLDLTTRSGLDEVQRAYEILKDSYKLINKPLPANKGGKNKANRELDCQVIQTLHVFRENSKLEPYDTVRAPFPEDDELYEGAGFRIRNHIQIAVRNPNCIKGYFRPMKNGQ